jgi:hypothetical protein
LISFDKLKSNEKESYRLGLCKVAFNRHFVPEFFHTVKVGMGASQKIFGLQVRVASSTQAVGLDHSSIRT